MWEEVELCQQGSSRSCTTSLATVFTSHQQEECREDFVKNCFIQFSQAALNVTVRVCRCEGQRVVYTL